MQNMLNTTELYEAARDLDKDYARRSKTSTSRAELRAELRAAYDALETQWQAWLAFAYAIDFSPRAHAAIFSKAWEDGHSSGYREVEQHYRELTEFVREALS